LVPKLRRIWWSCPCHCELLEPKCSGVHETGSTPGIFFQFGFLCDVLVWDEDELSYHRELPNDHAHKRFANSALYMLVSFDWGDYTGDVFAIPRQPHAEHADRSAFIHPILRVFRRGDQIATHHLLEDLFAVFCDDAHDFVYVRERAGMAVRDWHKRHHVEPLEEFIRGVFDMQPIEISAEHVDSAWSPAAVPS
jgi:hypothetical protein